MTLDVVGLKEIADRLGVPLKTVQAWQLYRKLPPAEGTVSGRPCWRGSTIDAWDAAGRPRQDDPQDRRRDGK